MSAPSQVSYHNGVQVDASSLHVNAFGPLALWGEGTFDTFRVAQGRALFLPQHQDRLSMACAALWGARPDVDASVNAAWAFLQNHAADFEHARGRVLVAPRDAERTRFDVFAELVPFEPAPLETYEKGVHAGFSRHAHPGLGAWGKSTSAIWSRMGAEEARMRGLDEMILCREEIVVESSWAAIIWREGGEWRTPAPSLNPLPSTTLAALRASGLHIDSVVATRERLTYADAIVLLSAVRLAIGVRSLEGRQFSSPDRAAAPLRELLLRA